jgi:hypothetical protein
LPLARTSRSVKRAVPPESSEILLNKPITSAMSWYGNLAGYHFAG